MLSVKITCFAGRIVTQFRGKTAQLIVESQNWGHPPLVEWAVKDFSIPNPSSTSASREDFIEPRWHADTYTPIKRLAHINQYKTD